MSIHLLNEAKNRINKEIDKIGFISTGYQTVSGLVLAVTIIKELIEEEEKRLEKYYDKDKLSEL